LAIKRSGISVSLMGQELKKFLRAVEEEERNAIALGESSGPLLDLYETADNIMVEVDLPGIDVEDVEVFFLNGMLTIEGIKKERVDSAGRINYLCMERTFDSFRRTLKIVVPINPKAASAKYERGVLTVIFPKVKEKRGQAIKIQVIT
jgi:HSP20 family protein